MCYPSSAGASTGGVGMTRCGLLCGIAALAALTAALLGPAWLHTEERLSHLHHQSRDRISVKFKLGLLKACSKVVKPANVTLTIPFTPCSKIPYKTLDDVNSRDLGFQQEFKLEFTPIVVTKMSERTLNTQIIPKYADYLKSKNVKGILVNGTVAEGMTMSVQERKQLAETWSQAAKKNNQHLVIQVGGTRLADVKDLAKHAQTVNADAILCLPEIYYRTSTMDELIDYMKEVSDAAPKTPLLFYHNPKRSNVTLQIGKFMEKAGKMIPTLVGLKFVGYDFEEGVDSLHENDQFVHILSAEKIIPSACVAGIDTFMIISSNLFPEMVQSMIDCCTKNDYIKAKETQKKLLWSVNQMTQLGHSFASIKAFMPLFTGIDVGPSRKPIPSYITDSDKEKILRIFDKISNEFKNYKYMITTPFQMVAGLLILAGTIAALIGHCCSDHRTLVACGLFLLGGLSLGGGLITLVSALSEIYTYSSPNEPEETSLPRYWYGWCLQLSGLALILSEIAALLTISGYMARFPTVEDMVRVMVPGAERKLREQRGLSSEYLVRTHQKSPGPAPCTTVTQPAKGPGPPRVTEEGTSLLHKTAPDICASNPQSAISYVDKADLSHVLPAYPETKIIDPSVVDSRLSGFVDKEGLIMDSRMLSEPRQNVVTFAEGKEASCQEPPVCFSDFPPPPSIPTDQPQLQVQQSTPVQQLPPLAFADKEVIALTSEQQQMVDSLLDAPWGHDSRCNSLAGQTVPINVKHHHQPRVSASPQPMHQNFGTIHTGVLRVAEPGTSSTTSSNCSSQRSMTLQNPKKKIPQAAQIAQNAFSTLEYERRRRGGGGGGGNPHPSVAAAGRTNNFCAGSAV